MPKMHGVGHNLVVFNNDPQFLAANRGWVLGTKPAEALWEGQPGTQCGSFWGQADQVRTDSEKWRRISLWTASQS